MFAGQSTAFASQSSNQVMGSEVNSNIMSSSSISKVEATKVYKSRRDRISPKDIHPFAQVLRNRNTATKKKCAPYSNFN